MGYIGTKPSNQVIDSTLIADGTVTTNDLANQAVTPTKLSAGAPNWNSSGNVGIGTSSPNADAKLDVIGNITIDSAFTATDYGLCFRRGFETSDNCRIYAGDTGVGREGGIRIAAFDGFSVGAGSNSWAEKFRISSNGAIQSVIPNNTTLYPDFACRAWVTFNGQGTPSIFASGGVTSVVRVSTGNYKVNFSFTLPDRDHAGVVTGDGNSVTNTVICEWANDDGNHTTSSGSVRSSAGEFRRYSVAVFR